MKTQVNTSTLKQSSKRLYGFFPQSNTQAYKQNLWISQIQEFAGWAFGAVTHFARGLERTAYFQIRLCARPQKSLSYGLMAATPAA